VSWVTASPKEVTVVAIVQSDKFNGQIDDCNLRMSAAEPCLGDRFGKVCMTANLGFCFISRLFQVPVLWNYNSQAAKRVDEYLQKGSWSLDCATS